MYQVVFHKQFLYGEVATNLHADAKALTKDELDSIFNFFNQVVEQEYLEGRNKESHTNSNGGIIWSALIYQRYNAWHYHSGPYSEAATKMTPPSLPKNLRGASSAPVIHYVKDKTRIIIIGYTREHIPFPDPNSRKNKLRSRLFDWRANVLKHSDVNNSNDDSGHAPA